MKTYADFSRFVVHFTKEQGGDPNSPYNTMISICWQRRLIAGNSFGAARTKAPEGTQRAVCFSEVPPHELGRLATRRKSKFGIAFTKSFIRAQGGGPIWYVGKNSPMATAVDSLISRGQLDPNDPIWQLTPLIDKPGNYGGAMYDFEWEREWRHVGDLTFSESDVAFLVIPEELHATAWGFFASALNENSGPAYLCPYIDPYWDQVRVQQALSSVHV
jgi:hypothetical protein